MSTRGQFLFRSVLTAAILSASGALAQTTPPPASTETAAPPAAAKPESAAPTDIGELIVTGSRIKRNNFSTDSPVQVITSEDAELQGSADTAQLLQQSTVANNATQINNFFAGFITTGGPGANTLSLRGLGSQRTLILIDGRRLGPAGVGGTVGPIDINTIPQSMIDHVDILKDGASSIYGSDAVAGVVNIITKKNIDGGELHVIANPSQHGGANTYEVDGRWGKTWDKGYLTLGIDAYRQDPLRYGQRPYFACATADTINLSTGLSGDAVDPATGKPKCFNIFTNTVIDYAPPAPTYSGASNPNTVGYYRPNSSSVLGGGPTGQDIPGWQAVGLGLPTTAATLTSQAEVNYTDNLYDDSTAISGVSRYTVTANAGYDISPSAHLYTQILLNRRDSQQVFDSEFFTFVNPGNVFNPGFGYPLPISPQIYSANQRVDYGRIVIGVDGDVPKFSIFKNWTYDIYGQFSHSQATYAQDFAYADRVNATAGSSNAAGCDPNANENGGYTMAQLEPNVACVPVNYFAAVQNGGFTPQEAAFLYGNEAGRTIYNHYYLEGTASGDLFRLPAGPVGAAFGFQVRREEIDDTPGEDFQDGNAYNYSSVGRTKGSDSIQEAFGELNIPLLKNLPFIESLDLHASGRFSNYLSYGSNETYKVGIAWKITDWLNFRASHGTAFRAPALYELFLADQVGFLGQTSIDPCINYGFSGVSQNVQKNCAAAGIPSNYGGQNSSSAEILTGGGIGHLKPETSVANTVGFVVAPKWGGLDLNIAIDYYSINISNQIAQFGAANILYQCYNSPTYPNSPFCSLFKRDTNPADPGYLGVLEVNNDYVNIAEEIDQGLDLNIRYRLNLPLDTKLTIESQNSWTFYTNTILLNGETNNYLGQVGQPTYVGNLSFRFDHGPWTVNYYINMVGRSSDNQFVPDIDNNYLGSGESVFLNHVVPFYSTTTVSVRRKFEGWAFEVGCKNIFDKDPPVYATEGFQARIGTAPLTSQYDWIGRSFFIDVKKDF